MQKHISRLPEVIKKTGLSRSNIYAQMSAGTFPKALKLGARSIGWLDSEIDSWIDEKVKSSHRGLAA